MTFESIQKELAGFQLVRQIDQVGVGHVRIETGLSYPDGSSIDVFVKHDPTLFPKLILTDFGQTTAWLISAMVKPWTSNKRQQIIEDVLRIYGAKSDGGALSLEVPGERELTTSILRLGQACIRVSDLYFTRRASIQSQAVDEVEEIIAETDLQFESGIEIPGKYNKPVKIDFLVHGRSTESAIMTLYGMNTSQVQSKSVDIFKRWYDLSSWENQKITIYDDRRDIYHDEDLKRIEDVSMLLPLSDSRTIREAIAA